MRLSPFALGLCLIVTAAPAWRIAAAEPTPESVWMTNFSAALAEAKKLNRPLVVHFYGKSCPPCRLMEREVLHTPQLLKTLDDGFIAVKLDLVKHPKEQARFSVEMMPTDLILSPEGKVLARSEGYLAGDKQKYLGTIARIDRQFAIEGKRLAKSDAGDDPVDSNINRTDEAKSRTKDAIAGVTKPHDKLVPPPLEPKILGDGSTGKTPDPDNRLPAIPDYVAMDGYCPVTLRMTRTWKAGSEKISLEHQGQTYYFSEASKRDEFKARPDRYAPSLMGCDPVTLADDDVAIRGSTQFGAYYDGVLFLFENAENRTKFKKDPLRYTRIKHVLKPEDIKRVATASTKD